MSLLLDTGVLHAFLDRRDPRHGDAADLMERTFRGHHGTPLTSTFVLDEAFTLLRTRRAGPEAHRRLASMVGIGTPDDPIRILDVPRWEIPGILERFWTDGDQGLSFTDSALLHHMEALEIDALATFDDGFEGLVPTVPS